MRPLPTDYPPYFEPYISKVKGDDLPAIMETGISALKDVLEKIPDAKADFSYAPDKWTVKQVIQHCIDTERVFAYRALCIARGETQPLPGFDQDIFATNADVANKSLSYLKNEMVIMRQSSVMLFDHFTETELSKTGTVSNYTTTVLALGFNIVGHWLHHYYILTDKYGI